MESRTDIQSLNGLRGFAALIVLLGHCSNAGLHVIPGINLASTAKGGVWLFFVLSAFLLTGKLVTELQVENPGKAIARYAWRRLLRILPLYYVVLSLIALFGWMGSGEMIGHMLLLDGRDHFWTIPVEMSFYAILPIIALGLSRLSSQMRVLAAVTLLAVSFAFYAALDPTALGHNSMNLANYAPFFAVGVLIAMLPPLRLAEPAALSIGLVGLLTAPLFSPPVFMALTGLDVVNALAWSWPWALAWGAVLFSLLHRSSLQNAFDLPFLRFVGKISFGVYLIHFHIILVVRDAEWLPMLLKPGVAVVVTGAVATTAFHVIEQPAIKFSHRLFRRHSEAV